MHNNISKTNNLGTNKNNQSFEASLFLTKLKNSIWLFGIPSCLLGVTDRSIASFSDGYLSALDLVQLFTASFLLISWLYLKPEESFNRGGVSTIQSYRTSSNPYLDEVHICKAQSRMLELQEYHMISQEYILPFPYLCQIYHLLNLKHLETIHTFSLNNLKVIKVSQFQPSGSGGILKFQTILDSPVNALRIWRQPVVEVGLILHTPYTVELNIPVYNNKKIIVMFNVVPISNTEHKLIIDIYSNLDWPKPLLQILLHFASCLTLWEDLPYLRKLAERNMHRLFNLNRASNQETMWLFRRFIDLYGSRLEPSQPIRAIAGDRIEMADDC
jgi:hypothetical protein